MWNAPVDGGGRRRSLKDGLLFWLLFVVIGLAIWVVSGWFLK